MAVIGILGLASMMLQAASGPIWWVARGVLDTNAVPDDFTAVNQGQLKWMAANAAMELESQLPDGAGSNVWALIDSFSNTNNYRPVNLGQLKYVAQPFYDRLIQVGYCTNYPWSASTNAAKDFALANIGQMKNVFSFDAATWMTLDSDSDGIPDWWMFQNFGHATGQSNDLSGAYDDADGDWSANLYEFHAGSDPHNENSTPPNNDLKLYLNWFNYAQVNLLRAVVGLKPTSWISSTNNNNARIVQLRDSIGGLLTNFLDTSCAFLDSTNATPNWTLASVLSSINSTNQTWLSGSASMLQVIELGEVLGKLQHLTYYGGTNSGTAYDYYDEYPSTNNFASYAIIENCPSNWPSTWGGTPYIHFLDSLDEIFNAHGYTLGDTLGPDYWPTFIQCNSLEDYLFSAELSGIWIMNATNYFVAGNRFGLRFVEPFQIVHKLSVPTVEARFQAKAGEINHGFDPTEIDPWTSMGVGSTNQIVRLSLGGSIDISNIVLVASDTNKVTVFPTNNLSVTNDLTIIGVAADTNTLIKVCLLGSTNAIATLHVMALPWRTNSVGIYRVTDSVSTNTVPEGAPTDNEVLTTLNDAFRQACVTFTNAIPGNPSTNMFISYDTYPCDSKMQTNEMAEVTAAAALWPGQLRVFFIKQSDIPYENDLSKRVRGATPDAPGKNSFVFTVNCTSAGDNISWVAAHEIGHTLKLSTRPNDWSKGKHDIGPYGDPNKRGLMQPGLCNKVIQNIRSLWLWHEDWWQANWTLKP